jgi:undecaprenyl diphosphate synthase
MKENNKKIPHHLGIIVDGNRRWAKEKGLETIEGHKEGFENVKRIVKLCKEKGIKVLTLFVFSTENWKRSKEEVSYLMDLFKKAFSDENVKEVYQNGVRVKIVGDKSLLSGLLKKLVRSIEEKTKNNKEMILNFALSYGGRNEIVKTVKKIVEKNIPAEKIKEETISENLLLPDVDLIVRPGRVKRISNFLIWQAAYSEFFFLDKYWPDFNEEDLDMILSDFANRKRRFGK